MKADMLGIKEKCLNEAGWDSRLIFGFVID